MRNFQKTRSVSVRITDGTDWRSEVKKYDYILLTCTDCVRLLRADADFPADRLVELRAFSEAGELHLCRVGSKMVGRIRTDGGDAGEETEYLEQRQLLWGKPQEYKNGMTRLHDDRGIDFSVPLEIPAGERAFLRVRSYLASDSFSFTDYRICGLIHGKVATDDDDE